MPKSPAIASVLLLLAACAPPEPTFVQEDPVPSVFLVHPQPNTVLEVDPCGCVDFQVAVYVENFSYQPFSPDRADAEVPGTEGHFHLDINNAYYGAPETLLSDVSLDGFTDGAGLSVKVSLVENQHTPIEIQDSNILEFVVEENLDLECSTSAICEASSTE